MENHRTLSDCASSLFGKTDCNIWLYLWWGIQNKLVTIGHYKAESERKAYRCFFFVVYKVGGIKQG